MMCLNIKERVRARARYILASTMRSSSFSSKIIQNKSQGATPKHRTLPLPNFARCNSITSHPATLSCCTLQHHAIAPCHFHLSHSATQKARFRPQNRPSSIGLAITSRLHGHKGLSHFGNDQEDFPPPRATLRTALGREALISNISLPDSGPSQDPCIAQEYQ